MERGRGDRSLFLAISFLGLPLFLIGRSRPLGVPSASFSLPPSFSPSSFPIAPGLTQKRERERERERKLFSSTHTHTHHRHREAAPPQSLSQGKERRRRKKVCDRREREGGGKGGGRKVYGDPSSSLSSSPGSVRRKEDDVSLAPLLSGERGSSLSLSLLDRSLCCPRHPQRRGVPLGQPGPPTSPTPSQFIIDANESTT